MTSKLLPIVFLAACNAASGGGTLTVTWALENLDGTAASCQPGFNQMRITTDGFEANGVEEGDPKSVSFDCAAGTGVIDLTGDFTLYDVTWEETDSTGSSVFMIDQISGTELVPTMVDISSGTATASTTMYPAGGWAWLEWGLFGSQVQDYIDTCGDAGVDKIQVDLTEMTSNASSTFMASCDAVPTSLTLDTIHGVGAINEPLLAGEYLITVTAFSAGQAVGSGTDDFLVEAPNRIDFSPEPIAIALTSR